MIRAAAVAPSSGDPMERTDEAMIVTAVTTFTAAPDGSSAAALYGAERGYR